jgi:hypothetical protein
LVHLLEQFPEEDARGRNSSSELLKDSEIGRQPQVAPEQSQVGQEAAVAQFAFGQELEHPTLLTGKEPGRGQLALYGGAFDPVRGLDLEQASLPVSHDNEEVGHDVADANGGAFLWPPYGRFGEQPDLAPVDRRSPGIPNHERLLLKSGHPRTGAEDRDGVCFQVALATDGPVFLGTGYQEKGSCRSPPEPECGEVGRRLWGGHVVSWRDDADEESLVAEFGAFGLGRFLRRDVVGTRGSLDRCARPRLRFWAFKRGIAAISFGTGAGRSQPWRLASIKAANFSAESSRKSDQRTS